MHGRDNIKLRTYICNYSHYMSRGHEAAVKSCFIHTSGNVAGTFIWSNCSYCVSSHTYPQGVALSEFFVPHDFTPMLSLQHVLPKFHLVELHGACCSNECCKKDNFYSVNSSGSCVCNFTTDLTNHRQQRNGKTIISCLCTYDKHTTE